MKSKYLLWGCMAVMLWSGCNDEEIYIENRPPADTPRIAIDGVIHQQYITRVDDGGFCDGDRIGIYGVNYTDENSTAGTLLDEGNQVDNAMYTFDEAAWTWRSQGDVYFKDAVTNIDLYGYYPYGMPESVSAYAFEVRQDQSGANVEDGYAMSDFLWGKATNVAPTDQKIKIKFSHIMACANVILKEGDGFAEGEFDALDKQVLAVNTMHRSLINLSTGEVTATGKVESEGIVMKQSADGFRAVVVPQTVAAGSALFVITVDGVTYRFKRSDNFTYAGGKQQKFTITVSRKELTGEYEFTLTHSEIVDWVADIESHGGEARQYYVVEQEEPGTLSQHLREAKKNPDKIKNLKIAGKIDARDFFFMRDSMEILQAINLKESEICLYGGYPAHEIPKKAFNNKMSLVYFVFPEKVTKIGSQSFHETLLSGALIIPNDVVEIEQDAFYGCNITSLQLPQGIKILGAYAFFSCNYLAGTLSLPESLESIGSCCFYQCSMLSGNLVLPSKLKEIPEECFFCCSFTGDLVIPEGVTVIGDRAFSGIRFGGRLYLPDGLKKIGSGAFYYCSFQGELVIPAQVQVLKQNCFGANDFTSIHFAENSELVKIEDSAFGENSRLYEPVVLPDNLITIGAHVFQYCSQLTAITIPANVSVIGEAAFGSCSYLSSITCHATMPPIVGNNAFAGVPKDNFTLEVPEQSVVKYQTATGWSDFRRVAAHHDFSISRPLMRTLNAEYSNTYVMRAPAHMAWSIESCPDWVTVTPSSGVGKTDVTVTVSEMSTAEAAAFDITTWDGTLLSSHTGRAGEVVFLLDGKDYRSTMTVQQFDSDIADGDVVENQRATVGGGVNIVFMGDCFDAKDIADGSYMAGIDEAIGYYFGIEPYKSYRDYFNVYTVVGMSEDSGMGTVNTVKSAKFGSMYSLDGITPDTEVTYRYAMKAATVNEDNLNRTLVVMVENTTDYGGICYMWGDGSAIAICPMSRDAYPYDFRGIVQHEAGGHGFAKLADEYINDNSFIQTCDHLLGFNAGKAMGWYRNLSTNSDMKTVEWAHFIYHHDYSNIVDMYEGGYFHTRGIYRSEATSCMNNNIPYYSAISRQEMVERIMKYAGLEFDIDDFYARDVRDASNNDITRSLIVDDIVTRASASKQMPPKIMGQKPQLR